MKRKIGIIILLLIIAVACFVIGQRNVKKSLFVLSEDFNSQKTEVGKKDMLYLPAGSVMEGAVDMGSSYVTLTFDYEWKVAEGQDIPENANLQIDVICPEMPDAPLQWAFEPGKIRESGSVAIDLTAFKGQNVQIKISCKGKFSGDIGIFLKNIYVSKLYM